MNAQKARYIVLRDGRVWDEVTTSRLDQAGDGALTLAELPAMPAGQQIVLDVPFETEASGLAFDSIGDLYTANTDRHRVVRQDRVCNSRVMLPGFEGPSNAPGHFKDPRGLLICPPERLYVADSGNQRIQVFRLPTLELQAIWEGQLQTPACLACDSRDRIYVLDRGLKRIIRFDSLGVSDSTYNAAMSSYSELQSPCFLTIDGDDTLYVSDDTSDAVLRFDSEGQFLGLFPAPDLDPSLRPRALAAFKDRLYVSDSASGHIQVFIRSTGLYLGMVSGYRGPVTAMTVGASGTLHIKSGMDDNVISISSDGGYAASGELAAGPFDAGDQSEWLRISVRADIAPRSNVRLKIFASDDSSTSPAEADWIDAASLDTLVPGAFDQQQQALRYLWLRLLLTSEEGFATPRLVQIRAETAGESYMKYLPTIYEMETAENGFLQRWLELFRSELGDLELSLEDMSRRFDPLLAPEDQLEWLAGWMAFDLPHNWTSEQKRLLIGRAHELYKRRGTLWGLREFVEIYAGVRPHIIEAFNERRLWQLDYTSTLGIDTALVPLSPNGLVVPDSDQLSGTSHQWGCSEPERLTVGEVVVGESGPLARQDMGEALFSDSAHRFTVLLPAAEVPDLARRQAVKEIIEAEKPAHTDYHLCFIEPRMRVGFQATIGIDSIISGPSDQMALSGALLGLDSVLSIDESDEGSSRVGKHARVGRDTVLR